MGTPAWIWFAVAVVAIVAGTVLLLSDRKSQSASNRERRRWAALRGWQFAEVDQVLPTRWERGVLAQHSGAVAKDIVAGSTFTADGRRQVYVLDLGSGGKASSVLVAVRCRRVTPTTVELWLPDMPVPRDAGLDLLGPVGSRYAFVAEVAAARPLITTGLIGATEDIGSDVTVVWLEQDWVLGALEPGADPARVERLLRDLGELADLIDPFELDPNEDYAARPESSEVDDLLSAEEDELDVEPDESARRR